MSEYLDRCERIQEESRRRLKETQGCLARSEAHLDKLEEFIRNHESEKIKASKVKF